MQFAVLPLDDALIPALQHKIDNKTKPLGSLGVLEQVALRVACILGSEEPVLQAPQMLVFAADHGLAAQGVSAYPVDVTWQMVENFLAGGAAVSVLARQNGIALNVVDCGVAKDFAPCEQDPEHKLPAAGEPRLWRRKIAYGSADCSQGAAAHVLAMQAIDGCLGFGIAAHLDETKAFGTAGIALHHDLGAGHCAELAELLQQVVVANSIGQVAHVKFVAHERTLSEKQINQAMSVLG